MQPSVSAVIGAGAVRAQNGTVDASVARGILVIVGGIMVHLTLGTLYCAGNLNPYVASYIHFRGAPKDFELTDMTWTSSVALMGQGTAMYFGGVLEKRLGPSLATFIGGSTLSAGVALSYFSIKQYWTGFMLTYGLLFGVGMGLAYTSPFVAAGRYFPTKTGLVIGLVDAGFGCGAFVFDQVQTKFINPDGDKPACQGPNKGYFTDNALLDRVPDVFLLLAGVYITMQVVGCSVIRNPVGFKHAPPRNKDTTVTKRHYEDGDSEESEAPLLGGKGHSGQQQRGQKAVQRSPLEAAKTVEFWLIWGAFGLNGLATVFFSSLWKSMGENYLPSVPDASWAIAGSVGSLFNAGGRIVWGAVADHIGVKRAIVAHCAVSCTLYFTLYPIRVLGYPVFFAWICALFFCIGGNFSLFPTAVAHAFGKESFGANYGCIFTSQAVAGVVGGLLASDLVHRAVSAVSTTTTAAPSFASAGWDGVDAVGDALSSPCPKGGAIHHDNYLPALLTVGCCTGCALLLAIAFLVRGGTPFLPFEPLAAKREAAALRAAGSVN
eukprot:m.10633 g.10633  ORF g.10633 m.10633 type:complete len:548 (+) comp2766_c0_seq1:43-1686(+)